MGTPISLSYFFPFHHGELWSLHKQSHYAIDVEGYFYTQVLVQWLPQEDASWERLLKLANDYSNLHLEDKCFSEEQ